MFELFKCRPARSAVPPPLMLGLPPVTFLPQAERAAVLVDTDNIQICLRRNFGRDLHWPSLCRLLDRTYRTWGMADIACGTATGGAGVGRHHGIQFPREMIRTFRGRELQANADVEIAVFAGLLAGSLGPGDVLICLTGDGDLLCGICRALHRALPGRAPQIAAVGVFGSMSQRIASNPSLATVSLLGADVTASLLGSQGG